MTISNIGDDKAIYQITISTEENILDATEGMHSKTDLTASKKFGLLDLLRRKLEFNTAITRTFKSLGNKGRYLSRLRISLALLNSKTNGS